jgi:transketolase
LYSALHVAGFPIEIEELKQFRQINSRCPGHLEYDLSLGVEATTGPLGQGLGMAVGMAISAKHCASLFNKTDIKLVNNNIYVLCGDGDLQEGISQEAFSLAGHLRLNNLIVLFDSNDVQLDSNTDKVQTEHLNLRMKAVN